MSGPPASPDTRARKRQCRVANASIDKRLGPNQQGTRHIHISRQSWPTYSMIRTRLVTRKPPGIKELIRHVI